MTKQPLKLDLGLESIMRAKDVSKNVSQMCLNTLEACGIGGVEGTLLSRGISESVTPRCHRVPAGNLTKGWKSKRAVGNTMLSELKH